MNPLSSGIPPESFAPAFCKPSRKPAKAKKPIRRAKSRPKKKKRSKKPGGSRKAILKRCDILWSAIVKVSGVCAVRQWYSHECKGGLQAMHGIPRTYKSTRWNTRNGFSGCAGAHLYLTWHPEEWSRYLVKAWGAEFFEAMWVSARTLGKPDAPAILAQLEAEARERGLTVS